MKRTNRAPRRQTVSLSAVTGNVTALATGGGFDMREILSYGRTVGGRNLRRLTFHQRATMLKKLAEHLTQHKEPLYKLSFQTGATRLRSSAIASSNQAASERHWADRSRYGPANTFLVFIRWILAGRGGLVYSQACRPRRIAVRARRAALRQQVAQPNAAA